MIPNHSSLVLFVSAALVLLEEIFPFAEQRGATCRVNPASSVVGRRRIHLRVSILNRSAKRSVLSSFALGNNQGDVVLLFMRAEPPNFIDNRGQQGL